MKFLGVTIDGNGIRLGGLRADTTAVAKAAVGVTQVPTTAVGSGGGVWGSGSRSSVWGVIRESFAGAWQRNVTIDATESILAFSSVYACLDLISKDISKLRPMLVQLKDGVWPETTNSAYSPVLRKPNSYQTRIQFFSQWILSKLIHGNTVVLKERDQRGVVVGLHVLNWKLVRVLVAEDGSVYYALSKDKLAGTDSVTVPASEIIHDRAACLFHPLIGVPPIYGCAMTVSQGNRIQSNSAKFFENMSRPSGMLTAPEIIPDATAERLRADFEANFSGANLGRLLVAGDGLKYEPMTIPPIQAQLIEQLEWTVKDVAACFHMPLYKLAGDTGVKYSNMAEMNQDYYNQTLHALIEDIELLLDEGLGLAGEGNQTMGVMFDLEALFRLDPSARATRNAAAVKGGYWAPNEARATDNLGPVAGGDEPMMQQQNYPLSVLAKQPPPNNAPAPAPAPAVDEVPPSEAAAKQFSAAVADIVVAVEKSIEAGEARNAEREAAADARHAEDLNEVGALAEKIDHQRSTAVAEFEAMRAAQAAAVEAATVEANAAIAPIVEAAQKSVTAAVEALTASIEATAAAEAQRAERGQLAERRLADALVVMTRATEQIEEERKERAEADQRAAEAESIRAAAAQVTTDTAPSEMMQALIARFAAATHDT